MNEWLIAVLIGVAFGLVIGIKIARDSHQKEPIKGGAPAQAVHYLAGALLTSVPPFAISGIIIGLSIVKLLGTGIVLLGATYGCLLILATFERPATSAA